MVSSSLDEKNNKRGGDGALGGIHLNTAHVVNPKYYQAYADYFVKFHKAYKNEGIPIYSISLQNESQNHPNWEKCIWHENEAIEFIGDFLGPTLKKNNIDTKLIIWDWDRVDFGHHSGFLNYNNTVLRNAKARKYIDGIAFHWYGGLGNAGTSWGRDFDRLQTMYDTYGVNLYATEACQENGPLLREYGPARRYTYDLINTFNNRTETWIDWNLVLDQGGLPTHHTTNPCHAPIMIDFKHDVWTKDASNSAVTYLDPKKRNPENDEIIYNPCYYVLKRFSQDIRPGSINIKTTLSKSSKDVFATAFINPRNTIISLFVGGVPNDGNLDFSATGSDSTVWIKYKGKYAKLEVKSDSLNTLRFKL